MRIASSREQSWSLSNCLLSGLGGKEASIKVKTDQGTQTGPEGAVGGTVREARKNLPPAATGKDPATGEKFGQESVACGSDSELVGDKEGERKGTGKKKRKKHKSKTGSSTEGKKATKETGTDTFNEGESKGSEKDKAPLVSDKGDSQVDSGGGNKDGGVGPGGGEGDGRVNSEKGIGSGKMDTGEGKGAVKVDSDKGDGIAGPGGGEGRGEEPVAKDSGDTELGAAGGGKKKLHVCACCDLAETLAKTFKRCQK